VLQTDSPNWTCTGDLPAFLAFPAQRATGTHRSGPAGVKLAGAEVHGSAPTWLHSALLMGVRFLGLFTGQ